MSESGQKSFEPTHARVEKAKVEGDVPRSTEVGAAFAFAAGLAGALVAVPHIAAGTQATLRQVARYPFASTDAGATLGIVALWALLPVVCSALVGSAVMLLQGGGLRVVAITLKFDRLHPLEGMK
nr:EscU/YscU/HrcU family type III secretion system export apparatus switch protein [Candidatus Eremiobacteraeota bacterium]